MDRFGVALCVAFVWVLPVVGGGVRFGAAGCVACVCVLPAAGVWVLPAAGVDVSVGWASGVSWWEAFRWASAPFSWVLVWWQAVAWFAWW